ncbi:aldo/keto reductase [Methylobacterium sp. Leaf456]|uniref:aldo/keto reductase n=1 Tax=Methylobacterium sp. Leaf456 TaxID=1736382 RepID=UPI0006F3F9D9|nr:aldo/keto reductase [Methylobacterium sp. Leaf456]KQT60140.1 aldo/keto reductase [Methylobacterium sp. Leaf456]
MSISRRTLLHGAALAAAGATLKGPGAARAAEEPLIVRPIPSTGERLPAMGIGTSRRYEVAVLSEATAPLREAVERFVALGGKVIDTAPSYGTAEDVLGLILEGLRDKIFLATKVAATGRAAAEAETERSFKRLRTDRIDLIAVHNLIDTESNLAILRGLKEKDRIRYVGVTVWRDDQFLELETVLKREKLDFLQVNYALDSRKAAERVLPLAQERGVAVMVNVPFGRDRLFTAVKGKPVPDFAKEFGCASWAQFFLKYVLANEAVTCPIPGMAKAQYVEDNMGAARGRLPDAAERRKMEAFIDAV